MRLSCWNNQKPSYPLVEKYPGVSSYTYCINNPVNLVDPDGMDIEEGSQKEWYKQKNAVIAQRDKLQSKTDGLKVKVAKQNNDDGKYARAVLKSDKESWCAAFANWNLETNGIDGTMHALAYSFKGFGQNLDKKPVFGSIAVMNYSHVGFIVGQNPDGSIILLGGNQPGDSVNLNPTNKSTILQTRYPRGYTPTSLPLPKMNVKRGSMSYGNTR